MLDWRTSFEVPKPSFPFGRYDAHLASAVIELDFWPFDLLTLTLVRIIARGISKCNYLPILMFLGLFVLDLRANTCQTHHARDIAILTFDPAGDGPSRRYGSSSSICTPSVKFVGLSVRKIWRTSGLNIMLAWWPWPLLLTLKLVCIIVRGVDNLPTSFGVSKTFRFRLIGQHLSDASRDLDLWAFQVTALVGDTGGPRTMYRGWSS